jgi:cytoskeleton protein RodZ
VFEIGSTLREARARQELDLHAAEQATRIRAKYLAALEEERFDLLPAEVYAKAFLRTYAEFLGLDSELYVAELHSRLVASRPPPPPPAPRRVSVPSVDLRTVGIVGLGAVVVVALVLAWRFGGGPGNGDVALAPPPSTASTTTEEPTTAPEHQRPPERVRLLLTAAGGDCWLSIHKGSSDGPVLFEGMLAEGDSRRFKAHRLWARIGAPWNLDARLNGQAVSELPKDTANVLVTRAGVKPEV